MELTMVEPPSFSWASSFSARWCWSGFFGHIQIFLRVSRGGTTGPGWFIWSKSACYSPARAYVYTRWVWIFISQQPSQFHHIQQQRRGWRTSQFTRVKEYEAMVGDLRFISVTPCLPFFFHPPFQKGRMSFTIPFSRVFNVACCKATPSSCWWDLSPVIYSFANLYFNSFGNSRSRSPAFLCTSNREWVLDDV